MSDLLRDLVLRDMRPPFSGPGVRLDYASAIRADISKQNYSVVPRYWYVDATFRCTRCRRDFCFSAADQRIWYEDYSFWVFVYPSKCRNCRRDLRRLKALRREYDQEIANAIRCKDLEPKLQVAKVIDALIQGGIDLPDKVCENRKVLANQIARRQIDVQSNVAFPPI